MSLHVWIEHAGNAAEAMGVLLILGGMAVAALRWVPAARRDTQAAYHQLRQDLGRAILLGLEVLVAADIVRTVTSSPGMGGVLVLAVIVGLRTFLSWSLTLEIDGRWPWQRDRHFAPTEPRP
jgi:uncharacterized membrane protein